MENKRKCSNPLCTQENPQFYFGSPMRRCIECHREKCRQGWHSTYGARRKKKRAAKPKKKRITKTKKCTRCGKTRYKSAYPNGGDICPKCYYAALTPAPITEKPKRKRKRRKPTQERVFAHPAYCLEQRSILMRLLVAYNEHRIYSALHVDDGYAARLVDDGLIWQPHPHTYELTPLGALATEHILESQCGHLSAEIRAQFEKDTIVSSGGD